MVAIMGMLIIPQFSYGQQKQPDLTARQKQINQEYQQAQKDISDLYLALKDKYADSVFSRQIDQIQAKIEKLKAEFNQIDKSKQADLKTEKPADKKE